MQQMLRRRHLEQAEHGVAYVEAMPPVVVCDVTVTLPHCVHPPGQCLREGDREMVGITQRTRSGKRQSDVHEKCYFRGLLDKL